MSITDELRDWGNRWEDVVADEVDAIADRIDIAHKHAIGYVDDRDPETMAENGWVKLPVDADGVPIHIGDRVENNERVVRIVLTDGSWEPSVYVEKLPNFLHEYFCHEVSHYQPDSWERIIEDAVKNGMYDHDNERIQQKLVERCKRLAGEA